MLEFMEEGSLFDHLHKKVNFLKIMNNIVSIYVQYNILADMASKDKNHEGHMSWNDLASQQQPSSYSSRHQIVRLPMF